MSNDITCNDHKLLWTFLSDVRGSIYSTTELEDYNYRLPFWLGRFLTNASLETRLCIYFGPTYVVQIQSPYFIHFLFYSSKNIGTFPCYIHFCVFNEDNNFRYMHHFYFSEALLTALVTQWMMTCSNVFWLNIFN